MTSLLQCPDRLQLTHSKFKRGIFSFLFVFLIFSNTWTFLSQQILRLINFAFPNIKFLRRDKERLHWLLQAVIGGAVGAAVLFVLGQAAVFFLEVVGALAHKNA